MSDPHLVRTRIPGFLALLCGIALGLLHYGRRVGLRLSDGIEPGGHVVPIAAGVVVVGVQGLSFGWYIDPRTMRAR